MEIRKVLVPIACVGLLAALSLPAWADDGAQSSDSQAAPDVTITVIPDGKDTADTVEQDISVPDDVSEHKPGSAPETGSKADNGKEFGQETADAAKEMEDQKDASEAAQHEAEDASQQAEAAQQASESQAEQARQNANQESDSGEQDQPDQPPPPPGGGS